MKSESMIKSFSTQKYFYQMKVLRCKNLNAFVNFERDNSWTIFLGFNLMTPYFDAERSSKTNTGGGGGV